MGGEARDEAPLTAPIYALAITQPGEHQPIRRSRRDTLLCLRGHQLLEVFLAIAVEVPPVPL